MAGIERPITDQFVSPAQQREAVQQGMWLFLATETMMFGVLLFAATYVRLGHPAAVAEAVAKLHYLLAGTNSALLLTSSLMVTPGPESGAGGSHAWRDPWLAGGQRPGGGFSAAQGL